MEEKKAIIHLENAAVFQQHNLILSDVTFSIGEGEFVYLVGQTGSGKSTLLKTLYADLKLERGKGEIAGYNLASLRQKDIPYLRRKIGIVFQDFQLLTDRSVYENLLFVLKATGWKQAAEMDTRINEVLGMVSLDTKSFKMPYELSGGEQQRLVIARALLNKPQVILADEPTGNLDPKTSDDILSLLHTISKGGTAILMATHDYRLIDKFAARVFRCEGGKLILDGKAQASY
jgi:cell division transport system ATP-binding protein